MNLQEIKSSLKNNQRVFWSNASYEVIKDNIGQYLIKCHLNNTFIGLTWLDGVTMNGEAIYSQAQEELEKLEEQIQLSFETPIDYMVG